MGYGYATSAQVNYVPRFVTCRFFSRMEHDLLLLFSHFLLPQVIYSSLPPKSVLEESEGPEEGRKRQELLWRHVSYGCRTVCRALLFLSGVSIACREAFHYRRDQSYYLGEGVGRDLRGLFAANWNGSERMLLNSNAFYSLNFSSWKRTLSHRFRVQ